VVFYLRRIRVGAIAMVECSFPLRFGAVQPDSQAIPSRLLLSLIYALLIHICCPVIGLSIQFVRPRSIALHEPRLFSADELLCNMAAFHQEELITELSGQKMCVILRVARARFIIVSIILALVKSGE